MSTPAERLAALKERLETGREENLKVVEQEQLSLTASVKNNNFETEGFKDEFSDLLSKQKNKGGVNKRQRQAVLDVGSADEADDENEDERLRSMKRRSRASVTFTSRIETLSTHANGAVNGNTSKDASASSKILIYGGAGDVESAALDNMVNELQCAEKRRAKYRRRRVFDEDQADISFINEGNRLFNRTLERHFDKFESVKDIKNNLERGTA